jgi:hypothetical protein
MLATTDGIIPTAAPIKAPISEAYIAPAVFNASCQNVSATTPTANIANTIVAWE